MADAVNTNRRNLLQLGGTAVLGVLCATNDTSAGDPPKESGGTPALVLAGSVSEKEKEYKGFTAKKFQEGSEEGYDITFGKELPRVPIVLVSSTAANCSVAVASVSKTGFRVSDWIIHRGAPLAWLVSFTFIVVVV